MSSGPTPATGDRPRSPRVGAGDAQFDISGRPISGRPVVGRPRRRYQSYLLALPALLLLSVIVVPMTLTVATAFTTPGGVGMSNFAALFDPGSGAAEAFLRSGAWIAIAALLMVVGFGIAVVTYREGRIWLFLRPALAIPFGVSALVTGAAFRILFDPAPERGTVTRMVTAWLGDSPVWLGPGTIWFVLASGFAWMWLGYIVSLFRASLQQIPEDLRRTVRAEGAGFWRRLYWVDIRIVMPTVGIVGLTLLVAAVRLFDLILITTPGAMQRSVDVPALHWWRTAGSATAGERAALALVLFIIVATVAVLVARGLRRRWAIPEPAPGPSRRPRDDRRATEGPRRDRWMPSLAVGLPVAVLWLVPWLVLVGTALRSPRDAGLAGWWALAPDSLSVASFSAVWTPGLVRSLTGTVLVAGFATLLVVAVAMPTAYLLAWGGMRAWQTRALTTVFIVLAVVPVQMYAAPLRDALDRLDVPGARLPLVLVHAAAGLPFAVLLLRARFASAPAGPVAEELLGYARPGTLISRFRRHYRPVLIAVAVLEFVLVWNDFVVGLLVSGPGSTPLTLVLWGEARQFAVAGGTVAASALISAVVPATLVVVFWRHIIRGLTAVTSR